MRMATILLAGWLALGLAPLVRAEGEWEITAESERSVDAGLDWLARNQGPSGNWESNNLGLVALGSLAFLSAGHLPDHGRYGPAVRRSLDFVMANAKPSGLLNISEPKHDMYNHGLATFVLTQAYGMTNDKRMYPVLDRALRLIADVQCDDGGWDYAAQRKRNGHDLSLGVMQAKALRGAMDIGLEIPPRTIEMALKSVRGYYRSFGGPDGKGPLYGTDPMAQSPGRFTYNGGGSTTAMAAAGVVCLQEFAQYDDFRIQRSIDAVLVDVRGIRPKSGQLPFDPYTLYYVAQGLYQVGGDRWKEGYPQLRDATVRSQVREPGNPRTNGSWNSGRWIRDNSTEGRMWGTAVGVFTLSIPNRYLPILQQAAPESLRGGRR